MIRSVLADWRTAPVDDRVRAALGFLEKLVLNPTEVGPADVAPLRKAGMDDAAIADVTYVCAAFSLIDRVADTLGWEVPDAERFNRLAALVVHIGYKLRF